MFVQQTLTRSERPHERSNERHMRTSIKEKVLKTAFIDTLLILVAFLILGMGFGVLMSDAGYSPFFVFLMSAFIYAGSMQFVAVSLIAAGTAETQKSTRCSREHRVASGANFPVCYRSCRSQQLRHFFIRRNHPFPANLPVARRSRPPRHQKAGKS